MASWAKVPTEPLLIEALTANDKMTYVALCIFANREGVCFPARATLSKYTGLSPRALTRSIANLCREGVVSLSERAGASSLYRVECIAAQSTPPPTGAAGMASPSIPDGEKVLDTSEVFQYFSECLPKHKIGNSREVAQWVRKEQRPRKWYTVLFETVCRRPFLCGLNDREVFFPLSFLLREADEILLRGKYAPWQEQAKATAEFIKNGGLMK